MSKLDDILNYPKPLPQSSIASAEGGPVFLNAIPDNTKQQIKELMLELIDNVDKAASIYEFPGVLFIDTDELRQKVEEL